MNRLLNLVHCPMLLFLIGYFCLSIICDSWVADFACKYWTILGLLTWFVIRGVYGVAGMNKSFQTDKILRTIFVFGILELCLAVFQLIGVCRSFNNLYYITGSFDNPAILAMLLSVCVPIGLYFMYRSSGNYSLWAIFTLGMWCILLIIESRTGVIASLCSFFVITSSQKRAFVSSLKEMRVWLIISAILFLGFLYFYKQDSADGRFLIWSVCIKMISEHPLFGWGYYGFDAYYMLFQADFLSQYLQTDKFILLADNVTNPFNEFLLVAVKYGYIGLFILCLMMVLLIGIIVRKRCDCKYVCLSMLLSLLLWLFFSYPSEIPYVWVLYLFLIYNSVQTWIRKRWQWCMELMLSILLFFCTFIDFKDEYKWIALHKQVQSENEDSVLFQYRCLYDKLKSNPDFLYNYGAVLHHFGHYEESMQILFECMQMYNDYNVQMIVADDYRQLEETQSAITCFRKAHAMVPNRFLPLYYEMKTYIEAADSVNAYFTAKQIVEKPVKVKNSPTINKIVREADLYIQEFHAHQLVPIKENL